MKLLRYVLLGFVIHMLYIDAILVHRENKIDNCYKSDKSDECFAYATTIPDRFYLKYFNIAGLLGYERIGNTKWRME
jgi:hypothetical protein